MSKADRVAKIQAVEKEIKDSKEQAKELEKKAKKLSENLELIKAGKRSSDDVVSADTEASLMDSMPSHEDDSRNDIAEEGRRANREKLLLIREADLDAYYERRTAGSIANGEACLDSDDFNENAFIVCCSSSKRLLLA